MKKVTISCLFFILVIFSPVISQDKYSFQSDITFGYSVLSSEDNPYFRNHYDFSEGAMIENLDFYLKNSEKSSWFDSFSVKARTGDRLDTGRKISVKLQKKGLYLFKITQKQDYDYFYDNDYNFGANNRNLTRNNVAVDFNWFGFSNLDVYAGYKQYESSGNIQNPFSDWGNIFALQFDKDVSYDEVKVGFMFHKNSFKFAVNQSWISVDDNSQYMSFQDTGSNNITLDNPTITGNVTSKIPTSSVKGSYYGEKMAVSFSYSKKDGSIDNNSLNLKNYFFDDFGAKTDRLVQLSGTTDTPTTDVNVFLTFSPVKSFSISYDFILTDTETDTNLNSMNTLNLYGTSTSPIVTIGDSQNTNFYYSNKRTKHGATVKYSPIDRIDLKVAYHQLDGDLENSLTNDSVLDSSVVEEYSSDKLEFGFDYKFSKGKLNASIFNEDIEDPFYRVSGAKKDGYNVSFSFLISDNLSLNSLYSNVKVKDNLTDINLDTENQLYDILVSYSVNSNLSFGVGATGIDYKNFINLVYSGSPENNQDSYDFNQQGYYVFANYDGQKRVKANVSFYYMDDSGSSLPLSNMIAKAKVQIKLTKSVFAVLTGNYFDYSEDYVASHDYNFNNLVIGFRWIYK